MLAEIGISELRIPCIIGVYPEERMQEQEILLSLNLQSDISEAAESDHIDDTIDYDRVAEVCRHIAQEGKFQLVETFCATTIKALFDQFPQLEEISIQVKKPGAIPKAQHASVRIVTHRRDLDS